jgi:glycosyltransferase involved in cell wall biosynthesis
MLRFGFVMEQTLGHVTHHQNLACMVEERPDIEPRWMPIRVNERDSWQSMPVVRNNWSLKASLRARDAIRRELRTGRLDALLFHTQTTALFSLPAMRRIPSVVSLDATPMNYDSVAEGYGDRADGVGFIARRKFEWNRASFRGAAHLVTWCQWAKDSLARDYGIDTERVTVIPPGVDIAAWSTAGSERPRTESGALRLLFVGGAFRRKGGHSLVEAFQGGLQAHCELDIVTRDQEAVSLCEGVAGVRVHTDMTPNCAALKALYHRADLFVFPTLADCLPIAVMEAMAAGLPVIATKVGALDEEVEHGVTGLLVPPNRPDVLGAAISDLAGDCGRRLAMSRAAAALASARFDARRNYSALLDVMTQVAGRTGTLGKR